MCTARTLLGKQNPSSQNLFTILNDVNGFIILTGRKERLHFTFKQEENMYKITVFVLNSVSHSETTIQIN